MAVSQFSFEYFGVISHIYLLFLLYPLYLFGFKKINDIAEKTITSIFLFFIILMFQALILPKEFSGKLGNIIIDTLNPSIGTAGLWLFVLIGLFISLLIIFKNFQNKFILMCESIFSKYDLITSKSISTQSKITINPKNYKNNILKEQEMFTNDNSTFKEDQFQKAVLKDNGEVAEITIKKIKKDITNETKIKKPLVVKSKQKIAKEIEIKKEPRSETQVHKQTSLVSELEENKKLLDAIEIGDIDKPNDFILPKPDLFQNPSNKIKNKINESAIDKKVADLLEKLAMFKIDGDVVRTYSGPIVTTFEFKPAPNVKVSKILSLQDDLAMALKAETIRIQAPIPGKDVVGIEVPNEDIQTIYMREILESDLFKKSASPLTMILGKDIVGNPFITDLKKLPHLLIAGTTGSGKSVGINAMILSFLYKNSPDNLKMIMIDPKMLEFSMYNDIPHLLTPVITKAAEAINALSNMVLEMEKRYKMMAKTRTKNIETFNEKAKIEKEYQPFPYIVIIIDELADLMMTSGKDVELSIARLAQMARASGIHLVVATQRPSVDVVTGLIKANLPSRVSYKVGQKIDSKIILDSIGAESLLGRGDLLFTPPGSSNLVRIHAPWSDESEIEKVVQFLKQQRQPQYDESIIKEKKGQSNSVNDSDIEDLDPMFDQAKNVVLEDNKTSISYLQRKLRIGYNRSATIIEQLEMMGILSAPNSKGTREIL